MSSTRAVHVTPSTLSSLALGCVEPRALDILVGKSTECRRHHGSRCFAVFVESYRQRYQLTKNKHKRGAITLEMYQILREQNIRFLRFDEQLSGWKEVTSKEARDKITHALKHAQKKHSRQDSKKRNVPQRNPSATSQRSDTSSRSSRSSVSAVSNFSNVSRRSLDWDQLQRNLRNSRVNAMAAAAAGNSHQRRSSIASSGSHASSSNHLDASSQGDLSYHQHRLSLTETTKSTSMYSLNSQATRTTCANDTVVTTESEPLSIDVSTIQHVDMFHPSVNREAIDDRLPKLPTRPINREAIDDRLPKLPTRPSYEGEDETEVDGDYSDFDGSANILNDEIPQHQSEEENDEDAFGRIGALFDETELQQDAVLASERQQQQALLDPLFENIMETDNGSNSTASTPPLSNVASAVAINPLVTELLHVNDTHVPPNGASQTATSRSVGIMGSSDLEPLLIRYDEDVMPSLEPLPVDYDGETDSAQAVTRYPPHDDTQSSEMDLDAFAAMMSQLATSDDKFQLSLASPNQQMSGNNWECYS